MAFVLLCRTRCPAVRRKRVREANAWKAIYVLGASVCLLRTQLVVRPEAVTATRERYAFPGTVCRLAILSRVVGVTAPVTTISSVSQDSAPRSPPILLWSVQSLARITRSAWLAYVPPSLIQLRVALAMSPVQLARSASEILVQD